MVIVIIILSAALIVCAVLYFLLKKDIRELKDSLNLIKNIDTNARLTTETFDKNICGLCNTINDILNKQKEIIINAEKSNNEFRQAITNISHDLRTPLTSAIGYVQMIQSDKTSPEKRTEYLDIIEKRLKSLSGLMNNLFEYTQIMEGKTTIDIQKVNVCNVLRDVISSFWGDFTGKGFNVNLDIPDMPVYAICDTAALKRIAENLTRNALEHGYNFFNLTVDPCNGEIIFKNRVSAPSELDINRMFNRFYTADFSRNNGNAGLGLAIVKELIEGMNGKINAILIEDVLEVKLVIPNSKAKNHF